MKKSTKSKKSREEDDDDDEEHGTKNVSKFLESLDDDEWQDTEETSFSEVPDDKYIVKINKAWVHKAKSSGRLQIGFECTIVEGKQKGRKLWKYQGIETEEDRGWARGTLTKLGVPWPKRAKDLPELLADEVEGTLAQVTVRTKPGEERSSMYFDKAVDEDDVDLDEEEEVKPKKKKGAKVEKEEEEDEDEDEEDEDEEDEEEEDEEEVKPKKKKNEEAEEDEDEDEDEEEEDEDEDEEDEDEEDEEEEDEEEEKKPKSKKKDADDDEEPKVEPEFDDDDIDKPLKKRISACVKALEYEEDVYKTTTEMIADMGEYLKISGTFKDPEKLVAKIEKALKTRE